MLTRLLILGDNDPIALTLRAVVRDELFEVENVHRESEALTLTEHLPFDPVVLDQQPMGQDRLAAGERGQDISPDTPVVIAIGLGLPATTRQEKIIRPRHWLRNFLKSLTAPDDELRRFAQEQDELRCAAEARVARLEDLIRHKDEILATVSHDLRAPLTVIKGSAQLLLRRMDHPEPDLAAVTRGLAGIDAQTMKIVRLLDDLLAASRGQSGGTEPRTKPCHIEDCLVTVIARLSPTERNRVDVARADGLLTGEWEQSMVEQVLANLIGNALKYSSEHTKVEVIVEQRSEMIEVAVADRGIGILPNELLTVFERFHRTPQAIASGVPGTGLGLHICRGIVIAHGGRIWAESPGEGEGTTVRFTLPISSLLSKSPESFAGRATRDGVAENWQLA
jgi:signal transduction histidine kinase